MAQAMGPLCDQVVFVGGCATGLLLDDAGLLDVRPTEDVDAIVEVASLANYHRLAEQLTQRGFRQTMADNTPPFRWYWSPKFLMNSITFSSFFEGLGTAFNAEKFFQIS
jgi:hypothetical protein